MTATTVVKRQPVFVSCDKLRPDTRGHNLKVKVVEANQLAVRPGKTSRLSECLVGDETATIILTARNDQVDLCKPGACLIVRNAKIDMFRTSMRLAVDQWGKVELASELDITPNVDNNLSNIEFELVQVPLEASTPDAEAPESAKTDTEHAADTSAT
ncbi:hypothetical protein WJX73_003282 [Symbiochloris irregularis]|uniref:Single-stranded DNA binding protein Ssb-like OB fold domain-containing protein n=1 Tax=Symbiochloris irregularis TaxID=706552 RepID=A0AAW1NJE6_9CHLO